MLVAHIFCFTVLFSSLFLFPSSCIVIFFSFFEYPWHIMSLFLVAFHSTLHNSFLTFAFIFKTFSVSNWDILTVYFLYFIYTKKTVCSNKLRVFFYWEFNGQDLLGRHVLWLVWFTKEWNTWITEVYFLVLLVIQKKKKNIVRWMEDENFWFILFNYL